MTTWTAESVLALAPDAGSAKSAQGLAAVRQWQSLARDDVALWGEIKGSGTSPYQARIDLREPAFKCTCPSRKFPCKHGLALLLVFAQDASVFAQQPQPQWVSDWLSGREQRQDKRAERAAPAEPSDTKARERRAEQREKRIESGLAELNVWLCDLVRTGLASAKTQPVAFWESMAARLVDAQAPGLARLVRRLEPAAQSGAGWEERLLHAIARLELIRVAWGRMDALPPALAEETRAAVGLATSQEALASAPAIADRWLILGIAHEHEERLSVRRTWLRGRNTGRHALLLDFGVPSQPMEPPLPIGCAFDGELVFYPGAAQARAQIRARKGGLVPASAALPGADTIEQALEGYADALGRVPWLERFPMLLRNVQVCVQPQLDGHPLAFLLDQAHHRIPLPARFAQAWHLLAVSGGRAIDAFGEWDGEILAPLTLTDGATWFSLGSGLNALHHGEAA